MLEPPWTTALEESACSERSRTGQVLEATGHFPLFDPFVLVADPFQEPGPLLREREPVQECSGSVQTEEFRSGLQLQGSATPAQVGILREQKFLLVAYTYFSA